MRLIISLVPTNKHGTKTSYTNFRKLLISDGFIQWGPELYMRVVTNRKNAETHIRRLQNIHPDTGTIRILQMTEKQFSSTIYLTREIDLQENIVGTNEVIML